METLPTPVNVGVTTSVAGADGAKSCEGDRTSPPLPASESHVVVLKDTTSHQQAEMHDQRAEVEGQLTDPWEQSTKQSVPFTKRGAAKVRSGRHRTRRSRSRSPIKARRRDKSP